MKGQPVIKYQYIKPSTKIALFMLFTVCMLFTGFVGGMFVALYEHPPGEPVTMNLELQLQNDTQLAAVESIEEPVIPKFVWEPEDMDKERKCLAENIYFESKSESQRGQLAVGLVTINRVLSKKYPNNICDVVWQKRKHPTTGKWVAQFSWTWDGKRDKPVNKESWEQAQLLAGALIAEGSLFNVADFTEGATHYHANYVDPYWNQHFTQTVVVDTHIFYRDEKATPKVIRALYQEAVAKVDELRI